jgi:GDP-L-fucose synthase
MKKESKIFIAGHRGLVGGAITKNLKSKGFNNLILKTREELDLLDQKAVEKFFQTEKPEFVFLAAAKVGGIMANKTYPAQFIQENLTIQNNILESARKSGVTKLLFLGSSCIYPRLAKQPIKEEALLSGPLESTNRAYAVAKIAGIVTCQSYNSQYGTNFISVMPTNLYGPNDNFDLENSHVLPALIRKFHEAKTLGKNEVTLWGTGKAKREFLHVEDLAEACIFLMEKYNDSEIVNIGTGIDISIKKLAEMVKKVTDFKGKIVWDKTKPDGTPRKVVNVNKIHKLGWKHKIDLAKGLESTYDWYLENLPIIKK